VLEAVWQTFGEDRLVFGSNWPVSNFSGDYDRQVAILEAFLVRKGVAAHNKVVNENAIMLYHLLARPRPSSSKPFSSTRRLRYSGARLVQVRSKKAARLQFRRGKRQKCL
jgi:hypothetical protein